jgi:hypothetical protein
MPAVATSALLLLLLLLLPVAGPNSTSSSSSSAAAASSIAAAERTPFLPLLLLRPLLPADSARMPYVLSALYIAHISNCGAAAAQ